MTSVVITSTGLIAPSGDTPERFAEALAHPQPATRPRLFDPAQLEGGSVHELLDFDPSAYLGDQNFRPLNRPALFAITAASQALARGRWDAESIAASEVGLVLGTMFGSIQTIAEFDYNAQKVGPKYAKPLDFANTVINAMAGQTAIWFHLTGINSTIASGSISGLYALGYASGLVESGRTRALLAGGSEELSLPAWLGFARRGLMGSQDAAGSQLPNDGFLLGEGAALLMLEHREHALARGALPLARVSGFASAFDPSRGLDTDRCAEALTRAITGALAQAKLEPGAIDACLASQNGVPHLDRGEALALARVFASHPIPVTALKGRIGEALGASGALTACAAVATLADGDLHAVVGTSAELAAQAPQPLQSIRLHARHLLLTAVGLDGSCCALILSAPA